MLERFLLLWLTLISAAAFYWPAPETLAVNPFLLDRRALGLLIAATMFVIGALLPRREVHDVLRRWPTVFGGTAVQYTAMPLLAFGCAALFGYRGDLMIGLILVGCVPGAMASNVLTMTARGNVSYSVSLTTLATMLSPVVVPSSLYLLVPEGTGGIDRRQMAEDSFVLLLSQVVGPVMCGYWLSTRWGAFGRLMRGCGPVVANLSILWIIAVVVHKNRDVVEQGLRLIPVLLTINAGGYLAGYWGGAAMRLPEGMRRAMTIEVGMQNAGLGSALASQLFPEQPLIAVPPALYMFGCMLTGTALAQWWSFRVPPETAGGAETAATSGAEPEGAELSETPLPSDA